MARPVNPEITDAMIELIPDDGSRIANKELRAAVEEKVGNAVSDEDFEMAKGVVVDMGIAQKAKGPGGGLKAASIKPKQTMPVVAEQITPGGVLTLSQLESHLWEAANILHGSPVDRSD